MKLPAFFAIFMAFTVGLTSAAGEGADQVTLQLKKSGAQAAVDIHSRMALPVSVMYPEYTIQGSPDLVNWQTVAGPIVGSQGVSDEWLRVAVSPAGDQAFYRAIAEVKLNADGDDNGAAIYGYDTEFKRELQTLGQLPLADFIAIYTPTNEYLPQISFDPTTAEFWDWFNVDPAVWNATNSWYNQRLYDFRLSPAEFAVFQTNGFVVSQRMERDSFADVFYDLYTDDLPVLVTTDAILHAWHRSFVTLLAEIEETGFQPTLSNLVVAMSAQVPSLWAQAQGTALTDGVLDADYFLAVARSLISGATHDGFLGQRARVAATLAAINNQQPVAWFNLFGQPRAVDFSQFQVRGHYASSEGLSNYFRTMMWCARADFRYAGAAMRADGNWATNNLRELAGAVALDFLLQDSGSFNAWLDFNRTLEMFVGVPDSLNFAQLHGLLSSAGIHSPADLPSREALIQLQGQLMSGQLGLQQITGDYYYAPFTPEALKLPRSFTVMGQRFVMDSWAFQKCLVKEILWDEDGFPGVEDLVMRRVPSALDVAFAVLGNDQTVPLLAGRISRTHLTFADGRPFWRDGLQYQHNLAAVRNVLDRQCPAAWTNSIYHHWLACLRELSAPTTDREYPEAMRTQAWAMKTLNTQLASWTQLRHNTVLYAKPSYTPILLCAYPDGYVEPRPTFWARMRSMAQATKSVLATLPASGVYTYTHSITNSAGFPEYLKVSVSGATMFSNRLAVMDEFVNTTRTLQTISEKELSRQPLSLDESLFLQHLVEFDYTGARTYTGWYPALFYQPGKDIVPLDPASGIQVSGDNEGSDYWDALVTDVHTDPPDQLTPDPGSILHEGIGNVQMLWIAVDCGPDDRAVYAGPVLSHYEFELGPTTRLTDAEWKDRVRAGLLPPQPEWTRSYLVPKP